MGRTGTNCRDRWRYIKPNKSTRQTGPWTKEETRLLIDSIYKLRKKADIQPYKVVYGAKISVSWEQIASLVQTRNAAQCRGKWNGFNTKHDNDIELAAQWTRSMDLLLIRAIKNAYLTHNARIPWKKVVAELSSSNVAANCHTARERWDHLKRSVLGYKTMKPVDVADFLETKLATS
ncbi:Cyclin-D-binding Myb-like transcription factor 1 [Zancudomyces culisetae]|uniref:Cyclin-D-binding Myb-like transcription factor 1 n=1 Tax=Zancudomyces culisetae TaxID=1213189 RepID=A0A1R1PJP3_ZANCU|nr:Cyclin-D-binding Myb-like transcription factor 1 [Zancudomyces culisetae]|eukprot:OMH81157.1 Cyclin-D-binding Myb-like transcription factor 1 [Zancudomyces culisetae]